MKYLLLMILLTGCSLHYKTYSCPERLLERVADQCGVTQDEQTTEDQGETPISDLVEQYRESRPKSGNDRNADTGAL